MTMKLPIVAFLIFVLIFKSIEACRCISSHPQTKFCNSDFAVIAVPISKSEGPSHIYEVRVEEKLKINDIAKAAFDVANPKIYTRAGSAACGVIFTLNKTYLILGNINGDSPWVGSCGYQRQLTNDQEDRSLIKRIQSLYEEGCPCQIEECHSDDSCMSAIADDVCVIDRRITPACEYQYSYCEKSKNDKCEWTSSQDYQNCKALQNTA